jgi:hypothetical protein
VARIGSFLGPSEAYGAPLSVIHPIDNDTTKSRFHASLRDPKLKLTETQMIELNDQILELLSILKLARDFTG